MFPLHASGFDQYTNKSNPHSANGQSIAERLLGLCRAKIKYLPSNLEPPRIQLNEERKVHALPLSPSCCVGPDGAGYDWM